STLLVVDASGKQPPKPLTDDYISREHGGAWACSPAISSDGRSIAFISDRVESFRYDVFITNRNGTKARPLGVTKVSPHSNSHPVFLPDGRSLLWLAGIEWNAGSRPIYSLWKVDTDGKNPRRIAESMLFTHPLQWKANQ